MKQGFVIVLRMHYPKFSSILVPSQLHPSPPNVRIVTFPAFILRESLINLKKKKKKKEYNIFIQTKLTLTKRV